jgi:ribosomal protein S12 methylthiotransferase accessory factor
MNVIPTGPARRRLTPRSDPDRSPTSLAGQRLTPRSDPDRSPTSLAGQCLTPRSDPDRSPTATWHERPTAGPPEVAGPRFGTGPVALVGAGALHDGLAHLSRLQWTDGIAGPLTVVAGDTAQTAEALWAQANSGHVPWLPVQGELDRVVIGPLVRPGVAGCPMCLRRRRLDTARDTKAHADLVAAHGDALARTRSPLLGPLAVDAAAALVAAEVAAWTAGRTVRTDRAAILLQLATLDVSVHRFLPDPHCPACGDGLPDDSAAAAVVAQRSRPKVSPEASRVRDLAAVESDLLASYVDPETGLLNRLRPSGDYLLPMVTAHRAGSANNEEGYGRTLDFRSSRLTAVAEALERMGGVRPGGKRTAVHGCYRELADQALDPTSLGLYPPERYASQDFPFQHYHDGLGMNWVWGYSFGRRQPVLVPEAYAYYGPQVRSGDGLPEHRPFVYEISNGCALGSCVEEAIVHGLIEVAERDAFLMTWYARMPVPELDPASATDPRVSLIIERIRHRTGYRVRVFSNALEQRIPCFWVMAIDESGDPDRPKALCAGGSALRPERGVVNALQELAMMIEYRLLTYPRDRDRARAMVDDPGLVRVMDDHALLYSHPDAFDRFAFLLDGAQPRPFRDFHGTWRWPRQGDLRADLDEMLGRYLGCGLDVVVVDQTTPEHRAGGFACVKAIVPGTLPMAFGHHARRVDGLPRLLDVPHRLGYRQRPLTPADINPHPHPFP